jgi:hypothetical protein
MSGENKMRLAIHRKLPALIALSLAIPAGFARAEDGGPCRKIREACEAAGFTKGGHKKGEGKGLFVDCMKKIADGETVPGVTVAAEDVAACKEKKGKRKERREHSKGAESGTPAASGSTAAPAGK